MPLATMTSSSTSSTRTLVCLLGPMVIAVPAREVGQALLERRVGMEADGRVERRDVGAGLLHVARLHRQELLHGFTAENAFERGDEVEQGDRAVVADVEDTM